jgi:hypothetical protein
MRLTHMTERIEFLSNKEVQNEDGVMVPQDNAIVFSCWAEVLNTPLGSLKTPRLKLAIARNHLTSLLNLNHNA